jgi:hypothetical protein
MRSHDLLIPRIRATAGRPPMHWRPFSMGYLLIAQAIEPAREHALLLVRRLALECADIVAGTDAAQGAPLIDG